MEFVRLKRAALKTKLGNYNGRSVTYRRPSTGNAITINASIGQSQATNFNSMLVTPTAQDVSVLDAEAANRDYIVKADSLSAIWPPRSGDLIDDASDTSGVTKRFQVMSLPGQDSWRWFTGGHQDEARIHTKYLSLYSPLWADSFTAADSTALTALTPSYPTSGLYSAGVGSIVVSSNRVVAGAATASGYFSIGTSDATVRATLNLAVSGAQIDNRYAELGLALRCESSGASKRDGYYCTLKVSAVNGVQTERQLRITERVSGADTVKASVDIGGEIEYDETYLLQVESEGTRIAVYLMDVTGEVPIASAAFDEAIMTSNTYGGLYFEHHASLPLLPWLDSLEAES